MSGPRIHVDYVSDTGDTYGLSMPQWAATLAGASAGTNQTPKPAGLRPRVRYVRITATGREKKIMAPDMGAAFWTNDFGTAAAVPVLGSGTSAPGTLEGRTGERTKHIG
jgi:hypothetical protein